MKPTSPAPHRDTVLLLLLAAPLYTWGLFHWPMWDAESWTLRVSGLPLRQLYDEVARDRHPPLFFLLEALLVQISASVAMIRLPAAVSALLTIVVVQRSAARHFDRETGWFAVLILALSPFLAAYAANARSGTMTGLLGATALASALSLVSGPRPRLAALGLSLSLGLGLWVHYDIALAVAGAATGGLLGLTLDPGDRKERLQRAGLGALAVLLPVVAFTPWLLGPMQSQALVEKAEPRSWLVWRFLWWPVGPDYRPFGGSLLVLFGLAGLIRGIGRDARGGLLAGWIGAGLLVSFLWSTNRDTLGKFYLYAPLQPLFALLVARGLASLVGLSRRWRAADSAPRWPVVGLSLGLLLLSIRPLLDVLTPTSSLVSVAPLSPGIYDPRLDAELLRKAAVGHPPRVMPEARVAFDWLVQAPELQPGLNGQAEPAWRALTRTDDQKLQQQYRMEAGAGCLFNEAFSAILVVPFPDDCAVLREAIIREGEARNHGPYLLEAAVMAGERGDQASSERYARAAVAASVVSVRPDTLLTRLLLDLGRPAEALESARRGVEKAERYHSRNDLFRLLKLQIDAARAAGDPSAAAEAEATTACLNDRLNSLEEAWCTDGILGFL